MTPRPTRFELLTVCLAALCLAAALAGATAMAQEGQVTYLPPTGDDTTPPHFRLDAHEFPYQQQMLSTSSPNIEISLLTFPSPVVTDNQYNNTVHCEYFRPTSAGPHPAVVVLHILGGDFDLSRIFCRQMAHNGVAALFLKLPYYGERAGPGDARRLVMSDPDLTVSALTQGILDIRRAAAWLAERDEVDPEQLGVMGISLGGITSALALTAEPRFKKGFLMLAGGDMAQITWESPLVAEVREQWIASGGTQESLYERVKVVDPVTYAENARDRDILMVNANFDEIVPRACTESLWRALGEPEIVWVDAGHYTAARFIFDAMALAVRHFQPE